VTASSQEIADQIGWTLVTVHRGESCEILRGEPEGLLGVAREELAADGLAGRVIGSMPSPCAWRESCDSSVYLLRESTGAARWVESRSQKDKDGSLVVCTRPAGPTEELAKLTLLSRLTLGGSLLGPLAHEVNNMVQGLSSAVYLFRDCLENGEPVELEDVEQLGEAVKELQRIGAEVQGFARLTHREAEPVNVRFIVEQAVRLLESTGKLKTIELKLELADDLPTMHLPALEVDSLVLALLNNAAEACLENTEMQQSLRVLATSENRRLILEFHDSGKGIALEEGLTPFASDKSPHRNIGLGLSAAAAIVGSLGGKLSASSSEQGSCLRVVLPAR
jgi:signal transduction histidine kinase